MEDELTDRIAALEARVAALEGAEVPESDPPSTDRFWALAGLKARVAADDAGAVLFTGTVRLPTGHTYDWQEAFDAAGLLGQDWPERADAFAALGHPVRLTLLREVLRGTELAADLAETAGLGTTGQLYHHIRQLVAAGWLRSPARGRYVVPPSRVIALLVMIAAGGGR